MIKSFELIVEFNLTVQNGYSINNCLSKTDVSNKLETIHENANGKEVALSIPYQWTYLPLPEPLITSPLTVQNHH